MNPVHAENIHLGETALQETEESSPSKPKEPSTPTGLALHQVFNQDLVLDKLGQQPLGMEAVAPSLWQRILAWFKGTNQDEIALGTTVAESSEIKPEAISPIPTIDPPTTSLEDFRATEPSTASKKDNLKIQFSPQDIDEALSLMSEETIDNIMFIIFKLQIQLEKENAQVAEKTFSKYLDFQKLQQQVLLEIKDALVNDEKIAKHFGTAQNIAFLATVLGGIVTLATQFGVLGPAWAFLSTACAAGLTATTTAGKAYFQHRMNEHEAEHEGYTHYNQYYSDCVDDSRERLMAHAEADGVFKERWIQFLRRSDKMRKLVFKK